MIRSSRLRVPALLLAAFAALLVFAGTASAETFAGETTSTAGSGAEPEAEITAAKATDDKSAGTIGFTITTKAEPLEKPGGESSKLDLYAYLFNATGTCDATAVTGYGYSYPILALVGYYEKREGLAGELTGSSTSSVLGLATMSVTGTTTTLSATYSQMAGLNLNCAFVYIAGGEEESEPLFFAITKQAEEPTTTTTTTTAPAPAAAALALGKAKTQSLKVGKWRTVKVKVTNTGGTASAQGSLRVKAPKGVLVKPETQKIPALQPGESWTLSVRVQLTAKAKKKSTLTLTGTTSDSSAKGSLVLKRTGK